MKQNTVIVIGKTLLKAGVALVLSNLANQNLKDSGKASYDIISQNIRFIRNQWLERKIAKTAGL